MSMHERREQSPMSQSDNSYFTDPESGAEMARVMDQDHLFTKAMGGLFSERSSLAGIRRILDIGCGPGGWALDIALTYPEIEVVGIDISEQAIDYARTQARVRGLENVTFLTMDATKPLDFPATSFDLVNARTIGFLPTGVWPNLMRECMRMLRSGGVIRLTESEWSFSTSPALERNNRDFLSCLESRRTKFLP